jgi:type IV pilus assembly protein PilF
LSRRYRFRLLASLLLSLLTSALAACASSGESREEQQRQARRVAEVNTQLGREYLSRGQYEIALEKLKKAIDADDDYAPSHTLLAVLYETIGETDEAADEYLAAVRVAPENGDVNNNYGAFLCRTGQGGRAMRYFDKALEDPFYRTPEVAMGNAGACALAMGDDARAEARLRRALDYDPTFPDALLSLAELKSRDGDYLRARAFLQRYESTGAVSPEALLTGFEVESALGNGREASGYRDRLLQNFPDSDEASKLIGAQGRSS